MSGIITGPYFKKYFHDPSPIDVGTMVAVLEVGAFSESFLPFHLGLYILLLTLYNSISNLTRCWPCWRPHRTPRHTTNWSCRIYDRRRCADVHCRVQIDDSRTDSQRIRCWFTFVSLLLSFSIYSCLAPFKFGLHLDFGLRLKRTTRPL
jgi:hypothetical protein